LVELTDNISWKVEQLLSTFLQSKQMNELRCLINTLTLEGIETEDIGTGDEKPRVHLKMSYVATYTSQAYQAEDSGAAPFLKFVGDIDMATQDQQIDISVQQNLQGSS
jgi:hypothetical protein